MLEADVEQQSQPAVPQPTEVVPQGSEPAQKGRSGEPRRRPPGGGNRPQKKPQTYQIADLSPGQELDGTVVRA